VNPTRGRKENRIRRNERKRRRTTTTTKKRDGARSSDETNQKLEKRDVISVSTCPFPSRLGRARAARTKKKKKKKKTPHSCRKAPRFSHHRTPTKTRTKERGGRRTSSLSLSLSVSCESCLPNFFMSFLGKKFFSSHTKKKKKKKMNSLLGLSGSFCAQTTTSRGGGAGFERRRGRESFCSCSSSSFSAFCVGSGKRGRGRRRMKKEQKSLLRSFPTATAQFSNNNNNDDKNSNGREEEGKDEGSFFAAARRNEIDDVLFSSVSSSSSSASSESSESSAFPVEAEIVVEKEEEEEEDDYEKWQKNTSPEARKKWNDVSKRSGEETTFKVGAQDLDEKFLSEVLLYLFKSNDQNVPAHLFLNKIKRSMTLDGYKAILVGCGRANKWELCEQIIDFVKKENKEKETDSSLDGIVTANWFVAIIDARIKEKSFADVASCFEKMFEFKCQPSGAAIESFARFTDFEYEFDEDLKERTRDIYEWLVDTDAGKALWPTYFGEAGVDNLPGKNSKNGKTKTIRVAMEAMDVDLGGDIDKLQQKLSDFY